MPEHWYLAQIKPNGLDRALTNLARQGFETFAPRQRAGRRMQPLFPGYVFVRFDPLETQWRAIGNTYGVARLVAARTDRPDRVPEGVMQALFARCDASGFLLPPDDLAVGDKVRIVEGPFAGWVTEVAGMKGAERVVVLLSLLGEENRTSLPLGSVHRL